MLSQTSSCSDKLGRSWAVYQEPFPVHCEIQNKSLRWAGDDCERSNNKSRGYYGNGTNRSVQKACTTTWLMMPAGNFSTMTGDSKCEHSFGNSTLEAASLLTLLNKGKANSSGSCKNGTIESSGRVASTCTLQRQAKQRWRTHLCGFKFCNKISAHSLERSAVTSHCTMANNKPGNSETVYRPHVWSFNDGSSEIPAWDKWD